MKKFFVKRQRGIIHILILVLKKDYYMYPAIFDYAADGISISFPDLHGCFSCADSDQEAMHMAKDTMGLYLFRMEKDNYDIPEPTPLNKINIEANQKVVYYVN